MSTHPPANARPRTPSLSGLLKPYTRFLVLMLALAIGSNALSLSLPKVIARAIDSATQAHFSLQVLAIEFLLIALGVFVLAYTQSLVQTYTSERVARDLRKRIATKISHQSYQYIQQATPSKLLTNLTSDVDAIKLFVSQAIVSIASSLFIIIGASILLLSINIRLALSVLAVLPLIAFSFYIVFSRIGSLFRRSQQIIDALNKVINESILGSALIRVLHAQKEEYEKFLVVNTDAKNVGLSVLKLFASIIPVITFLSSIATLVILLYGGRLVIVGSMTLGQLAAFNSYISVLIFPILIIGFMSNAIARATASYGRISEVLTLPETFVDGTITTLLRGAIEVKNVTVTYGEREALKQVSTTIHAGTRTAILGPTAAGKTQLLYTLMGLLPPTTGEILYDGVKLSEYEREVFSKQVGFVFQDSVLFQLSVRENIALRTSVSKADLDRAIETAELSEFIATLPEGLETSVSERGMSLSGGQKQRIMLARALALNPKVLLLDDFTARVDAQTEKQILNNLEKNYPNLTLISVTQKIAPIEHFDHIILLMEGEIVAEGTHSELLARSPEYVQISQSQQSTNRYEDHA
ncbi:ABC transporter ATP-binding protein [Patescibacteria group bacterium]|nr:ABC transporter ATP-binding protein [Patescibacteria group bacterium]